VPDSRPPLPRWTVLVVAVAVLLVSAAALVVLWVWIDSLRFADVDKRATAHLEAVKVASAIAVGGGGLFALYLAARRQRAQELELDLRREEVRARDLDAAERRIMESYTKAADQLGSEKAPVRLAGMYALVRLADDHPQHRQLVIDLLCAYLRMPFAVSEQEAGQPTGEREVRHTAQGLLASRIRPYLDPEQHERRNPRHWAELYEFNLAGATLVDFDMSGCHFGPAIFTRARFIGEAVFRDAVFASGVQFDDVLFRDGAEFTSARFEVDANFMRVRCKKDAWFNSADFATDATFEDARFDDYCSFAHVSFGWNAFFGAVRFEEVDFQTASFKRAAWFDKSWFQGAANFQKAQFHARLDLADSIGSPTATTYLDKRSMWPAGWTLGEAAGPGGEWRKLVQT
jgi:uncharacterized protein YjbI with pentapeptide repeats